MIARLGIQMTLATKKYMIKRLTISRYIWVPIPRSFIAAMGVPRGYLQLQAEASDANIIREH